MTRDEIIRMARECGLMMRDEPMHGVERFAALVAAAEREAMKLDGWRQCAKGQRTTQYCGQLEAAVSAEREACATKCESHYDTAQAARAIRARGEA